MDRTILIVDDDRELSILLRDVLAKEYITAMLAHDGLEGLEKVQQREFQLIVLDIMLPKLNGFEVLTALREHTQTPVLMLTAKNDESDKVSGLRLGADDYMTKPFGINEFLARVQSLIRRYTTYSGVKAPLGRVLTFGDLLIDEARRTAVVHGKSLELTGKEFDVLLFLASGSGQVFTKKQIYNQVWQDEYAFDDSNVMSYISKLRKKMTDFGANTDYIQTVWGVGYRFCGEENK